MFHNVPIIRNGKEPQIRERFSLVEQTSPKYFNIYTLFVKGIYMQGPQAVSLTREDMANCFHWKYKPFHIDLQL